MEIASEPGLRTHSLLQVFATQMKKFVLKYPKLN